MAPNSKDHFYSEVQLREIAEDIEKTVTVPVNVMVEADHRVYDLREVERILRAANKIVLQDCGCRKEYRNCDAPLDVCLGLDEDAEYALKSGGGRVVSLGEALKVLERSHEAGLVHMAYVMKGKEKPGLICSCCPCCCHTLGGLLRYGIHAQVLSSSFLASDVEEKCVQCGKCVQRCVFGARSMNDGLVYEESKCMGCGLCVTTCPTNAISMKPRIN